MAEQQTHTTQIIGAIIKVGPVESFGANGFKKCTVVIDTGGKYPQQIPIEFVKDKADLASSELQVGDMAIVDYNLRGREYNGRYYASVEGWRWKVTGAVPVGDADTPEDSDGCGF